MCEIPSERYGHGATMLDESTMAVYGGYSNECEDYCDDLWLFDAASLQWMEVKSASNPGNRWKFSMVGGFGTEGSSIYLFGGHRLWHGMAQDNSAENRWQSTELLPKGGYLDDLWVLKSNQPDGNLKEWVKIEGKDTCVDAPGLTWESLVTLLYTTTREAACGFMADFRLTIRIRRALAQVVVSVLNHWEGNMSLFSPPMHFTSTTFGFTMPDRDIGRRSRSLGGNLNEERITSSL